MAAQELAKAHERDLGITIVALPEMVYSVEEDRYMPQAAVQPGHTIGKISGTKFRQMLRGSEEVPSWFSFPEVIDELRRGHARKSAQSGITIFFTGLSGAGKSTTAMVLRSKLLELQDRSVSLLDGDIVRRHLSKGLGFSREDRDTNVERIGYVASEITRHGGIAICSAISPFKDARDKNRELIEQYGTYIEVFVSTPLAECAKRDPKGIYKKALAGTMKGVTGVDDPYEAPQNPEITIDTSTMTPVESADVIVKYLRDAELL
jgi:sulfate adenylyltransferase